MGIRTRPTIGWHSPQQWPPQHRDPGIWTWLTDPESLTRKLRQQAGDRLSLLLFEERRTALTPEEILFLESPGEKWGLRREVGFFSSSDLWVFSSTLVPDETLRQEPWLAELGETPLGDRVFGEGLGARVRLEIAQVGAGWAFYEAARPHLGTAPPPSFWARRSLIRVAGRLLLVQDGFIGETGPWRAQKDTAT
ncbi:chorismate--pyruvate lyase [mine drainage metagenome]|uniref:Chorismate--pyruvate lyase n=1 Tax=mine drainage metagenome TaxID=410659 RepID=T1A8V0_9ZZZZ